tara:strand:- start:7057 stop:7248 length:192 start_codon:yes stop_codon:yes gene_type:complete
MSKMAELAAERDKWSDDNFVDYLLGKVELIYENKGEANNVQKKKKRNNYSLDIRRNDILNSKK